MAHAGPHAVHFYDRDEQLFDRAAEFLAAGDRAVVIATRAHCDGIAASLRARGFNRVEYIDAQDALQSFMSEAIPDATRFNAFATPLVSGRVRIYCELVDLLARDGNAAAALEVERLWNERDGDFSLLWGCSLGSVAGECDARKRAERELRDFVENASEGMHWVGPDGTILWANNAELELLGYTREEYIGRNIVDIHADRAIIEDILRRLKAKEELRDYEARLRAKDGSIRHVSINSNVLFEDGKFVHTRCFTRDISDRKRLELERAFLLQAGVALHRSLDRDQIAGELMKLIVPRLADWCAIDLVLDDRLVRAGAAHVDASLTERIRRVGDFEALQRVLATGEPEVSSDLTLEVFAASAPLRQELHALGSESWMIVPLLVGDRVTGAITFVCGVSDRRYEATDLLLATELASRAAIAFENARLYRLAERANRAKDEFLATLSHELRTPLTAVMGWARMLALGELDAETSRTAVEVIEQSARAQATLIEDLLDLSRIATGKFRLNNAPVDISAVVATAVQTQRLAAEAKGIRLVVNGGDDAKVVNGDANRLQQVIWNLLSNAIKFSDGGEVSVTLAATHDATRLTVRDTGRGIAPDFLPHVFEAFRQADAASTREHGGLGLGLAIVKHVTELHGGSVTAESAGEGQGATFVVTLPVRAVTAPTVAALAASSPARTHTQSAAASVHYTPSP